MFSWVRVAFCPFLHILAFYVLQFLENCSIFSNKIWHRCNLKFTDVFEILCQLPKKLTSYALAGCVSHLSLDLTWNKISVFIHSEIAIGRCTTKYLFYIIAEPIKIFLWKCSIFINPWMPGGKKRSHILKQTCSWKGYLPSGIKGLKQQQQPKLGFFFVCMCCSLKI